MVLTIILAFLALISLTVIHELGHFLTARKFGIKVEEFGIGYPPRIFGKKIGETIYSLNLLPFGAFVKIYGQEQKIDSPESFSVKPFWQKSLVILGGVVSFWIVAAFLLTIVMIIGVPSLVEDEENKNLTDPKVQIALIVPDSPAELSGLKIGDTIREVEISASSGEKENIKIDKVKQVQDLIDDSRGEEIVLVIQRGKEIARVSLEPRISPPEDEGPMGVALARTALKKYPWYLAPVKGVSATFQLTGLAVNGWAMLFSSLFRGQGIPSFVEVRGPVGIFELFLQAGQAGFSYFLQFIAIISVFIALFNVLPIPALDGGWFLFLVIEKIRGKEINQRISNGISVFFFFLLIALMILVTIKDIARLF